MKILKPFILGSLMLAATSAFACGPYYYSAIDYRIYRLLPPDWKMPADDFVTKNILSWSWQTGCKDTAAIRRALYTDWNYCSDWEALLYEMTTTVAAPYNPMTENAFCRHLVETMDTDAVRLLCWSKTYSNIRSKQRSPWYYNAYFDFRDDESSELGALYNMALNYKPARRYADRFTFLTIKCGWASRVRDAEVVALWNKSSLKKKSNLFHEETGDYVARCLIQMGRKEEADAIYKENGNYVEMIPNGDTPAQLQFLLCNCPNSPQIAGVLQNYLSTLDEEYASVTYGGYDSEGRDFYKTEDVLRIARTAIANPRVRQKAMWRYAAACVLDYRGRQREALDVLKGAEGGGGNEFLQKSVRTLTFYLRAKSDTINDDFERYAIGEIKWLVGQMQHEWHRMPDTLRHKISHIIDIYWSYHTLRDLCSYTTLNRIVLEDSVGLAWRMAAAGRGGRALQMANVADNYLFQLSGNLLIKKNREQGGGVYEVDYRDSNNTRHDGVYLLRLQDTSSIDGKICFVWHHQKNLIDYSNGLFRVADILDARTLEAYRQRQLRPLDETDRWFNAHSYTNGDYWQDIIGTHYMRERNYYAATRHLRYVSPSYQQRMNISCSIDPFSIDRTLKSIDSTHYKLRFAQRMDSLSRAMLRDRDADRRGLAMLEYTIGLENSFDVCWWLTSYDKGWNGADLIDIEETQYAHRASAIVKQLRSKALCTLRTDDARARYFARLGQLKTVVQCYTDTPTAQHYALVCDTWKEYRRR